MGKYYTQTTAALNAVTIDTAKLDANKILIYPGEGDRNTRKNLLEVIAEKGAGSDKIDELNRVIFGNAGEYTFTTNTTNDTAETAGRGIQISKKHFIKPGITIKSLTLPYHGADYTRQNQYVHIQFFNEAGTLIKKIDSIDTQSRAFDSSGISTWTFDENTTVPDDYSYAHITLSGSKGDNPNMPAGSACSTYTINVIRKNGSVTFDDDLCQCYDANGYVNNYLAEVIIKYVDVSGGLVSSVDDLKETIETFGTKNFAYTDTNNTFTGDVNVFNRVEVVPDSNAGYIVTLSDSGVSTYRDVFAYNLLRSQQGIKALPLNTKTAAGEDAYGISVTYPDANGGKGGLQLWGTHFMQGDEWSDNALKIVHNELALFGNHQAPCSLTFDNANVVNFRVMPDDGSTANGGQGAIFDFQGWQWDNNDHTSKNADCPVQILKNNAGSLTERSVLNKAELDENYIIANDDNKHIVDTLNDYVSVITKHAIGWFIPGYLTDNTIIINGVEYHSTSGETYEEGFANGINAVADAPVTASFNGTKVVLTAKVPGIEGTNITIGYKNPPSPNDGSFSSGETLKLDSVNFAEKESSIKRIDYLTNIDNNFARLHNSNSFTNDIIIDGAKLILINGASLEIPDEEVSIVSETAGDSTIITYSDEEIITAKVISYRQVTTEISPLVTITKRVPAEAYLNLINIDDMLNSMWANMAQAAPFDYEPFVEEYTSSGMQEGPNGWLFTIKRKHLGQLQLAFSQISNALTEVGGNSFEVIIL